MEWRFDAYCDALVKVLSNADRSQPARWYLKGLMLPGSRKDVEPMAARVHPEEVRSAHQSMHHLVAHAEWSDDAVCTGIIDDTGFPRKGTHSVAVARQY